MPRDDSRRVSVLLGILFGVAGMGSSSAAVILPVMSADLQISIGATAWTISLYALMLAVTTAVYGRISDLVGVRLPLVVGIALMVAGAVVAALAPSYPALLVARAFQGAGAAAVPTLGVALLSGRYDGAVRGVALGRLAGVAAAVSSLGPLVGGVVSEAFGWRAVLVLPALSLLVVPLLWDALHNRGSGARLDLVGAVLVAMTAAGMVMLVQSPSTGVAVAVAGGLLVVLGTPAVAAWVRRRPHGFLPLEVVRNPAVMRSAVAAAAIPAAWFALLVAIPVVLAEKGWAVWSVGLLLLPGGLVGLLMPTYAGRLLVRVGATRTIAISGLLATISVLMAALGTWLVSGTVLAVAIVGVALAFGLGQPALSTAVGDAVEVSVRGVALGVATLLFLVGGSVGSAVVGGLGGPLGMPQSLLVLTSLPVLGLLVLLPLLKRAPALV